MSKQQRQIDPLEFPRETNESFELNKLLKKYLFHWPLFVIGIAITLALAYCYVKITPPVYPISATLEFNSPTATSTGIPERMNALQQVLDPLSKPVIVENELEVMKSKKIVFQVVNNLQLWVTYIQKGTGFLSKDKDLYKSTPVKFQFIKQSGTISGEGEKLEIHIKNRKSFLLTTAKKELKSYNFSSPIKSVFGTWQLLPTASFDNFIDSTLIIKVENPDIVADSYQKSIKTALEDKNAPFVNLTYSDMVPERGKDVLNSLLELYQKSALQEKNIESQKALDFIELRFDSVRHDLDTIDQRMAKYKSSQGLTDIRDQAVTTQQTKLDNIRAINDVDLQLKSIGVFEKYFNSDQKNKALPSVSNITDVSLTDLYQQLTTLQLQRERLLATLPPTNPIFTGLNNQIATLQNDFHSKIEALKGSLIATKRQLQSNSAGVQSVIRKIPLQDKAYNTIKREQDIKSKLYEDLLNLREQLSLRFNSSVSDSQVVDDAHAGKSKWPIPLVIYAMALIAGLAAPAGLLYARENLHDYIISKQQIEEETNVRVLGELSYQDSSTPIVVTEGRGKFAIGEQFRMLRTNLYHLHGNTGSGRVTLFTSSIGGEGKSFVTSNLATTLAYSSRKTIILEMDLRKPKISENFGLSSEHPGISEFLADEAADLSTLIQHTYIQNLDVMSCGTIQPNPSELLEKNKLDELIDELRGRYDDVLIDSPPLHIVTDSKIIARVTDVTLYMIMQGHTNKDELEFISEINDSKWFPKLSVVFNGIKSEKFGYGYNTSNGYYNSYNLNKEKNGLGSQLKHFLTRF